MKRTNRSMSTGHLTVAAVCLFALACGGEGGTDLQRSCRGRAVPNCLPYEASVLTEATVTPSGVLVGDPSVDVSFRVAFDRCPDLERSHQVTVQILDDERLLDLLTLSDDGLGGDAMAGDGLIEKTVGNPFIGTEVPAGRTVTLRFQTRAFPDCSSGMCFGGTCRSEVLEVPYTLGARFEPE